MLIDIESNHEAQRAITTAQAASNYAGALEVVDTESRDQAADELRQITTRRAQVEKLRTDLKAPVLEAGRRIDEFFRAPLTLLDDAATAIKGKLLTFQRAEEEKRQAAERAAREAAERAAREARERAEAEAEALRQKAAQAEAEGNVAAAAEAAAEAETVTAQAELEADAVTSAAMTTSMPTARRMSGVGIRQNWQAEVTDLAELVRAAAENPQAFLPYLQANGSALSAIAKSTKGSIKIPGVRIYDAGSVSARRIGG